MLFTDNVTNKVKFPKGERNKTDRNGEKSLTFFREVYVGRICHHLRCNARLHQRPAKFQSEKKRITFTNSLQGNQHTLKERSLIAH